MNINNSNLYNKTYQKPSFGSIRLFKVNLQKILPDGTTSNIPAYFSRLTQKDSELINKISENLNSLRFGKEITDEFMKFPGANKKNYNYINEKVRKNFFVIERTDEKNPLKRIASIMVANIHGDHIYLETLQSTAKLQEKEIIKGGGELALKGLTNYAKKTKKNYIELVTAIDNWYKKMGFDFNKGSYKLNKENYNNLINLMNHKYN